MADLDILRHDLINKRVNGRPGGHNIHFDAKDAAKIIEYCNDMPEQVIRAAATERKRLDFDRAALMRRVAASGIEVKSEMQPGDLNFLVCASAEVCDLSNDLVKQSGIDKSIFKTNPVVPPFHNTAVVPVAAANPLWQSGDATLAIFRFPQPGVSDGSDQMSAAMQAGLIRGVSIGFQPTKWAFSTDKNRPLGIDFFEIRLLEISLCSVPCCPPCIVLGAVDSKSAPGKSADDAALEQRVVEARVLAAKARSMSESISDPAPTTREERLAQAAEFRRMAYSVNRK